MKPEILDNPKTAGLSDTAARLFLALMLEADDYGNGYGDIRRLKARIWWATEPAIPVEQALGELTESGLVVSYYDDGKHYLQIAGWTQHQRVDRPGRPRVPGPGPIGDRDRGRRSEISRETPANARETPANARETPANARETPANARPQAPDAWCVLSAAMGARLAPIRSAATCTGLPPAQEDAWLRAWTECRTRWTVADLERAGRWLAAGGWAYRGQLNPMALAKGLETLLQDSASWDGNPLQGSQADDESPSPYVEFHKDDTK